jgi:hypothetical protein
MEKKIVLTPEWVFENLPHTRYADGEGNVSLYTDDSTDANFIELALDTLNISYETYDYLDDDNDIVFGFDFKIIDIEVECPSFYQSMKEIDNNNMNYKNLSKN